MSSRGVYPALNRDVGRPANFVGRTADVPNAKLREVARRATGHIGIANLQMLKVTFLDGFAGHVQLSVQEQAEAPIFVARESNMRPGSGRDWLGGDDDVVDLAADPDAKAVVVEVGIQRGRPREDRVLIANARIEIHPALDRERTAQSEVGVHVIPVAATETHHRFNELPNSATNSFTAVSSGRTALNLSSV